MPEFGDPIDPEFLPDEQLFLAVSPESYVNGADQALLSHTRFPKFSVNRGKYSAPIDVTRPHFVGWAVAAFFVKDIPPRIEAQPQGDDAPKAFTFGPEHYPEDGNYAHAHVCAYAEGGAPTKPSKWVRTTFRELLRQRLVFVLEPS